MTERTHISKEQYSGIVKEMAKDQQRSERQRQVERAHGQDLPSLLSTLHRKHDGNASAVLRDLNKRLTGSSISRPTLYNWLDEYEVREKDGGSGNEKGGVSKTPDGVPENANSIEDPSECDGRVVEGPRGGTYCVPEGGEGEGDRDLSGLADEDGTLDAADLQAGDTVLINEDEVTLDAVAEDSNGHVVQFQKGGEDFFLYGDLVEIRAPGGAGDAADGEGEGGGEGAPAGEGGQDDGVSVGQEFELSDGTSATVQDYDSTTGVVAYETEEGETDLITEEAVLGTDAEDTPEGRDADLAETANVQYANTDGLSDEQFETVSTAVEAYQEQYDIPEDAIVGITTQKPGDSESPGGAVASYSASSRELYVNPEQFDSQTAQDSFESGFSATPGGEGTVNHELTHAEHFQEVLSDPDMNLTEMQEADLPGDLEATVEQEVSTYAATSPVEMVAEVKAGRMNGQEYSDTVMEAYRDFNGPEI